MLMETKYYRFRTIISIGMLVLVLTAQFTLSEDTLIEEELEKHKQSPQHPQLEDTESAETAETAETAGTADTAERAFHEIDPQDEKVEPLSDTPIIITDSNWRQLDKGEWLIEFYAPWCPACRALQSRWDKLARDVKDMNELRVKIAKCDVTDNPWLTGRMMIASLPSIFHVNDKEYRKYSGPRNPEDFYDYILKKKWKDTPLLEKWREPHGAAMTAMSAFYKLANVVQNAHDLMTISYGFPVWASYVIFRLATLACGLTACLVIVCCMDCLSTPTTPERRLAIVEKNKKAREEREKQAALLAEIEAKKDIRESPDPDEAEEVLKAEVVVQQEVRNGEWKEGEKEDEEEDVVRKRKGYQLIEEEDLGRESTEEEEDYDEESEDDRGDTEGDTEDEEEVKKNK